MVDDVAYDNSVRELVVALVRQGITSTVTRHDGSRYGVLHIDSNLPDVRLVIGGRGENAFLDRLLEDAGPRYADELDRQLSEESSARMWVPAEVPSGRRPEPIPDLRGVRDLPVLVLSGVDTERTTQAVEALIADLADGVAVVKQPNELAGDTGHVDDHTVAVLNRGLPGFNVEADGSLYLSLLRSCSGWPSSVLDRSTASFRAQRVELPVPALEPHLRVRADILGRRLASRADGAVGARLQQSAGRATAGPSRGRDARGCQSHPDRAVLGGPDRGQTSRQSTRPDGRACRRPRARDRAAPVRVGGQVDRSSDQLPPGPSAKPRSRTWRKRAIDRWRSSTAASTSSSNHSRSRPCRSSPRFRPEAPTGAEFGPGREAAQPVFAGYWLHNKGPAPMGYQPLTVQARPWRLEGPGPFVVRVIVASERTDAPVAGTVSIVCPTRLAGLAHRATVPAGARRPPRLRGPGRAGDRRAVGALLRRRPDRRRGRPGPRGRRTGRSHGGGR